MDTRIHRWIYLLAWLVLGYLAVQLIMLLSTSIDSRGIGFVDTVMGLLPALVGVVVAVELRARHSEAIRLSGACSLSNDWHEPT